MQIERADIAIIGAGAAGLMAGIWAGRTQAGRRIVLLDGAQKLGAKILVAGGGRCNVTHDVVDEDAYAGASPNAVKKVLRRFDVPETTRFFAELGVTLKREDTGKLFPTTDSARTVLDALVGGVRAAGARILHPYRVDEAVDCGDHFQVRGAWGALNAPVLILATGGKSLPKSGSDGQGYTLARGFGHSLTHHVFPALVPLVLPPDHFVRALSGLTVTTTLEVRAATGKVLKRFTGSTLCTHFGLSGPAPLDISRYYTAARLADAQTQLTINWLPDFDSERFDARLRALGRGGVYRLLHDHAPERLARALCQQAGIEPGVTGDALPREARRKLVTAATALPLPVTGDRGFTYAEVTAGGIPLHEMHLNTMQSRLRPGLFFCGEICDVDGRIGGYNFQWAWASGYVAGISAQPLPSPA